MAAKPTLNDARWAETAGGSAAANLAAGSEGKKDTGFGTTAEVLAGSLLNWMHREAYRWFKYVDGIFVDIAAAAWTWTNNHVFTPSAGTAIDATGVGTGVGVKGTGGNTNGHGVHGVGGTNGTGVRGEANGTATGGVFVGGTTNGTGVGGQGLGTGPGGSFSNGTAATGATRQTALVLTNGDIDMGGVAYPNSTAAAVNRLTPSNIPKAWGRVGSATPGVTGGFNISAVADVSNNLQVTLTSAMANSNYAVVPSIQGDAVVPLVTIDSASQFHVVLLQLDGTPRDWSAFAGIGGIVSFAVFGAQ